MPDLVAFTTPEGGRLVVDPVYPAGVESPGSAGFAHRGNLAESGAVAMVQHGIDDLLNELKAPLGELMKAFSHLAEGIETVELAFSLGLTAAAGVVVSRVGAEANFTVTVTWKRDGTLEAKPTDPS